MKKITSINEMINYIRFRVKPTKVYMISGFTDDHEYEGIISLDGKYIIWIRRLEKNHICMLGRETTEYDSFMKRITTKKPTLSGWAYL